jgi:hypothetical protein
VHMTWGAINELSTLNGYHRVIAKTRHPILSQLLTRIIKDERRHYAFYYNQARARLEDNPRAQKLVRWALDRLWSPVGTGVRPRAETDYVILALFGDEDGAAAVREMEAELSKLPGLNGMRLMRRAMSQAAQRAGRSLRSPRRALPVAASLV